MAKLKKCGRKWHNNDTMRAEILEWKVEDGLKGRRRSSTKPILTAYFWLILRLSWWWWQYGDGGGKSGSEDRLHWFPIIMTQISCKLYMLFGLPYKRTTATTTITATRPFHAKNISVHELYFKHYTEIRALDGREQTQCWHFVAWPGLTFAEITGGIGSKNESLSHHQ